MSAGVITGTSKVENLPEDSEIAELTGGENPVEYLTMNAETIFGVIAGMSDRDRIEGWRRAEIEQIDSDRDVVLEALDRQEVCLERGDTPPIYHPIHDRYDPATDPLVDGEEDDVQDGEAETESADGDGEAESDDEEEDEDVQEATDEAHTEPDHDVHPEANLEPGEVLVMPHVETTEYVWAARTDADDPYILREHAGEGYSFETTIGVSEAFSMVRHGAEKKQVDDVTVDAPLEAAVVGGGSDAE